MARYWASFGYFFLTPLRSMFLIRHVLEYMQTPVEFGLEKNVSFEVNTAVAVIFVSVAVNLVVNFYIICGFLQWIFFHLIQRKEKRQVLLLFTAFNSNLHFVRLFQRWHFDPRTLKELIVEVIMHFHVNGEYLEQILNEVLPLSGREGDAASHKRTRDLIRGQDGTTPVANLLNCKVHLKLFIA